MPRPTKPPSDVYRHSFGTKLRDSDLVALLPFIETFTGSNKGEALRWLLDHPAVRKVIRDRIDGAMIQS